MSNVLIENDIVYLFLEWLGWDYNFWNVIFADIILTVAMFVIVVLIVIIGVCLDVIT